jgi:hypothetical protein
MPRKIASASGRRFCARRTEPSRFWITGSFGALPASDSANAEAFLRSPCRKSVIGVTASGAFVEMTFSISKRSP